MLRSPFFWLAALAMALTACSGGYFAPGGCQVLIVGAVLLGLGIAIWHRRRNRPRPGDFILIDGDKVRRFDRKKEALSGDHWRIIAIHQVFGLHVPAFELDLWQPGKTKSVFVLADGRIIDARDLELFCSPRPGLCNGSLNEEDFPL